MLSSSETGAGAGRAAKGNHEETTHRLAPLFTEAHPESGASEKELEAALADLRRPLSEEEIEQIAPVLDAVTGNLGYEDAVLAASSSLQTCWGTTDPGDRYMR